MPIVNVWKNMTVKDLSNTSGRTVSDVLQAISYSDNKRYTKDTIIEDRNILFNVVKKLGAKYKIVPKPDEMLKNKNLATCDAVKRLI